MIGEGVLGYGVVGLNTRVRRTILSGIAQSNRARLAAVCSRDQAKASAMTAEFGGTPYTALPDLLADPSVDVVFVCTPHGLHRPMSIDALRAGKMVICEKPLALTLDEADEMAAVAGEIGLPNLVNFTYHSLPGPRFVDRLLAQQTIGRLLHLDFSYWQARQRLPGAASASALLDIGSHQVDLAHWWCEAGGAGSIAEVTAQELASPDLGQPIFSALARTTGGALVTIQANRVAAGWKNGMVSRFVGERGTITLTFDTDLTSVEVARIGDGSPEGMTRAVPIPAEFFVSYAAFPAYHIDRLTAALLGEIGFPDFAYGRHCQALLEAIRESTQQHRWVEIS